MGEKEIRTLLREARSKGWDDQTLVQQAIEMARVLYVSTQKSMRSEERTFIAAVKRLATDAGSRRFLHGLCNAVMLEGESAIEKLKLLLEHHGGIPTFFSSLTRLRMRAVIMAPRSMQGTASAELKRIFRSTFGELVLPIHESKPGKRAVNIRKEGACLMLRPLSPQVFGQRGAEVYERRLTELLTEQPGPGIVLEPHRLCPELSPTSPEFSVQRLADKLQRIFTIARQNGNVPLTIKPYLSDTTGIIIAALKRVLDSPNFDSQSIALELPAYLLSSIHHLRDVAAWTETRSQRGATPLKILLVKGDYLEEQKTCSARYGSAAQLCESKSETDANFIQLLEAAVAYPASCITPVVGTHELMLLSYAALLWARSGREGMPPLSLLLGLGNHIGRTFAALGSQVDLVAGIAEEAEGGNAFRRYLMHILRELARDGSYLFIGNATSAETIDWSAKAKPIMAAHSKHRTASPDDDDDGQWKPSYSEIAAERAEVDACYAAARAEVERTQQPIPLRLEDTVLSTPLTRIHRSLVVPGLEDYRADVADYEAVYRTLQWARERSAQPPLPPEERAMALRRAAHELKKRRFEFVSLLVRDAGFTIADADVEIRDTYDTLRYTAMQDETWRDIQDGTQITPIGVVVVTTGNARPLFDAASGIAAAWMAGNTIIYKPTDHFILLATRFAELMLSVGVRLAVLPCSDSNISRKLVSDSCVAAVVGPNIAEQVPLLAAANTGTTVSASPVHGPAVYLAASCDRAFALREITRAAFYRSGQATSCPHLILVHSSLYNDPAFFSAIEDITETKQCRPTWLEGADLGPISSPLGEGERMLLTCRDSGLTWRLPPRSDSPSDSRLWRPGVCTGVTPQCDFVRFGRRLPLIGLVCVADAHEAARIQRPFSHATAAIIFSQDSDEISSWQREVDCRRVCINCCAGVRTGVFPEPTWQASGRTSCGPMRGLMSSVIALCRCTEHGRPSSRSTRRDLVFDPKDTLPASSDVDSVMRLSAAADSISYWWEHLFGAEHLLPPAEGMQATLSFSPESVCLRVDKRLSNEDLAIALMAIMQAGAHLELSVAEARDWLMLFAEQRTIPLRVSTDDDFIADFASLAARNVLLRYPGAPASVVEQAARCALRFNASPVLSNGRPELALYLHEKVCIRRLFCPNAFLSE